MLEHSFCVNNLILKGKQAREKKESQLEEDREILERGKGGAHAYKIQKLRQPTKRHRDRNK